ncbi:hypothetical protein [Bacillus sp. UNC41MFS5]|nr:hypothetical protein [Bacillus sp. UNC41MFS5]
MIIEPVKNRGVTIIEKEVRVEYPHSTTLHNITNVRIVSNEGDAVR